MATSQRESVEAKMAMAVVSQQYPPTKNAAAAAAAAVKAAPATATAAATTLLLLRSPGSKVKVELFRFGGFFRRFEAAAPSAFPGFLTGDGRRSHRQFVASSVSANNGNENTDNQNGASAAVAVPLPPFK